MDWIRMILLILGTCFIVAGTAISWHVFRTNDFPASAEKSGTQYWGISFFFALLTAWLFWLGGSKDVAGKNIYAFLFYGLFFYNHVLGYENWRTADDIRFDRTDNNGDYTIDGSPTMGHEDLKRLMASCILNYIGLYLCLAVVHGKFEIRVNIASFLFLFAIACDIVGIIILWNLSDIKHVGGNPQARLWVFDQIAVPQTAILLILAGSVWHERADGAGAAALLIGIWGLWYLVYGFYLKGILQGDNQSQGQIDKMWAGTILCWASTWISIVVARFAHVHHVTVVAVA